MNARKLVSFVAAMFAACATITASAQALQYGQDVTLDQARKALAAAVLEARKQNLQVAVAVVDNAGLLVAFERMDQTQHGSVSVAQGKASTAAMYRRPTKTLQDALAAGGAGLRLLSLPGLVAIEGGVPLVVDNRIIGAIGVSGGSAEQDGAVARAGLDGFSR